MEKSIFNINNNFSSSFSKCVDLWIEDTNHYESTCQNTLDQNFARNNVEKPLQRKYFPLFIYVYLTYIRPYKNIQSIKEKDYSLLDHNKVYQTHSYF